MWGEGPAVYFMHGWGGSGLQIRSMIDPLVARGYRVVTFDGPGHGSSARRPTHAGEFGTALTAVTARYGQAHGIVAHSLGAVAVCRAAIADGLRVDRLILLAPLVEAGPMLDRFADLLELGPRTRALLPEETALQTGLRMDQFTSRDLPTLVDGGSALIVHDRHDSFTPFADTLALSRAWPDSTLVPTEGLGHQRLLHDPTVTATVVRFLTQLPPGSRRAGTPGDCGRSGVERTRGDRRQLIMDPDVPPSWRLIALMDGFVTTQLIYVAAKLGLAGLLQDGPRSGAELADAVGAGTEPLTRVLRGLAAVGVLAEDDGDRFALTDVGRALGPLRDMALVRGEVYYRAAAGLLDSVRHGDVAFERVYGETFFDHLARHSDLEDAFQGSMAGRSAQEAADVVAVYDFAGLRTVVDVGGGHGVLLAAILQAHPDLDGILLDRESVIAGAPPLLRRAHVSDRVRCVAGDFFEEVPSGADAYVLSRVLHDWSDVDARRILRTCRRALPRHGRLVIVDAILPERATEGPLAIGMDLHMLLLFGAGERTRAQFHALLGEAGFAVRRIIPTASPAGLGVVEAVPDWASD